MNISSKKIISLLFLTGLFLVPFIALGFDVIDIAGNELGDSDLSKRSVSTITRTLMNWLLVLITVLSVISFIISGIFFIFGGNDSGRIEIAKSWLVYSIIGLIVALSGYVIINLVYDLSRADMINQNPSQVEVEEITE